jgi:EAL domain-containing protein (putative c-di-GMP-specific phosphodiesterase class I)
LKLDKSLIHGMTQQPRTAAMVQAIISLGAELRVDVIAEGVETPAQLAMLKDFNCPRAQGFLLARPMPAVQAQVVLRKPWGNLTKAPLRPSAFRQAGLAHQDRAYSASCV